MKQTTTGGKRMKNLVIRNTPQFKEIKLVNVNGTYHAVLSDISKALGNKKTSSNVYRVCKNAIKHPVPTNGGIQMAIVIPVSDVQRVIIKSEMPLAAEFEDWANEELIPFMIGSH